jgi:hypothetical protein
MERLPRRTWLVVGLAALATVISAALLLDRSGGHHQAPSAARPARPANGVPATSVFAKSPYMGVACGVPNSTACDRIGLAVWLRVPAVAVTAEVQGRRFALDDPHWSGPVRKHRRRMFAGFLRGAGLLRDFHLPSHWEGQPARSPLVRVLIDHGRGAPVETRLRVTLSPGWG